ncbi:helix-turn-helix domain-containing protein [uncultured Ilyobacter sp.]|uniref:helix-turn-helix domain-containing protein n=1 Tax=uncultured Ilyobacter sp. TaxID=544433 RepID=UPI0029C7239A|nr:helix-turn-helix domain-containing protein [uncultured Ilyobacter sp.]
MSHKHFTIDEKESILKFLKLDFNLEKIDNEIRKHKSSINREIKRNKSCRAKNKLEDSM